MRQFLSPFLLIALLFITPTIALAQIAPTHMQLKPTMQALRQEARDQFKEKLAQIKDTRKQAIVSRVDTRIQTINTNRTTEMMAALNRLDKILTRVATKSSTITSAPSQDELTNAKAKIAAAHTAVSAQQTKQYIMSITSDATLRQDVMTTLTTFKTDITATHQTVLDAKEAVIKAIQSLEGTAKDNISPSVSPTDTINL